MLELLELKRIVAEEDRYILHIEIPTFLFNHYLDFFRSIEGFAGQMNYKARIARSNTEQAQSEREKERRAYKDSVKAEMRVLYHSKLKETRSHVEGMKAVTAAYKLYKFIRVEFKEEVQAQWELAIPKMLAEGKTSFQIAEVLGISPGAVRKIMSNCKTQLKCTREIV